ncbi:hypothetical protein [Rhizobium phage RHph_X2_26]|nr:hypothetical protein [Rhizobium phage RHph_X2_26]
MGKTIRERWIIADVSEGQAGFRSNRRAKRNERRRAREEKRSQRQAAERDALDTYFLDMALDAAESRELDEAIDIADYADPWADDWDFWDGDEYEETDPYRGVHDDFDPWHYGDDYY